jgi:hypothetical protein
VPGVVRRQEAEPSASPTGGELKVEDNLHMGPRVIERRAQIQWDVRLRICLPLDPSRLPTYSVAHLREVKNYNGKFQNT